HRYARSNEDTRPVRLHRGSRLSDRSEEVLYPIRLVLSGLLINWVTDAISCNSRQEEKDLFLHKGADTPRLFTVSGKYYVQARKADIPMPGIRITNKTTNKPHCDSA